MTGCRDSPSSENSYGLLGTEKSDYVRKAENCRQIYHKPFLLCSETKPFGKTAVRHTLPSRVRWSSSRSASLNRRPREQGHAAATGQWSRQSCVLTRSVCHHLCSCSVDSVSRPVFDQRALSTARVVMPRAWLSSLTMSTRPSAAS